jgi:uncharacterized membrane protein YheB (UPF0754 family)
MFWFMMLVSMAVAAFIGGVTNHLAIKMLFFPYEVKRVFGLRVPFTPGIIPKRRDEIAGSFGRIVSTHLITSDGMKNWLRQPQFAAQLESSIDVLLRNALHQDLTLASALSKFVGEQQLQQWQASAAHWARAKAASILQYVWEEKGVGTQSLSELLSSWNEEKRRAWSAKATGFAFSELEKGIQSEQGEQFLRKMVEQLITAVAGDGMLGGMVRGFLNVDSLTVKLRAALLEKLDEPASRTLVETWLSGKIEEWERFSLADILRMLTGSDGRIWLEQQLLGRIDWNLQVGQLFSLPIAEFLTDRDGHSLVSAKVIVAYIIDLLDQHLESIMSTLDLAKLVEDQVAKFPIEQIERMILDVSGREFRAITWLGAVLGGIIGFVQYLLITMLN